MKFNLCLFSILFLIMHFPDNAFAQDTTVSLAFKNNRPASSYPMYYAPDLSYKLQQQFQLIKMANAGDPLAQHELGLRFLQGIDAPADTIKATEWIKKAAEKDLTAACYNYGILLLNGWGTEWNPFDAFINFEKAAEDGMPQAQYITGIIYTENLIVQKDIGKALEWLNKAMGKGYEPAKEFIKELNEKSSAKDSTAFNNNPLNNSSLVFIDFDLETDTAQSVSEADLNKALFSSGNEKLIAGSKVVNDNDSIIDPSRIDVDLLKETAEAGSPEALTLLGYWYETGKHFTQDPVKAGIYYYLAAKLDSRQGAFLLWKLNNSFQLYKGLEKRVKQNDAEALFLLYALESFKFTDIVSEEQAEDLLNKASDAGLEYAMLERSLNGYSGRYDEMTKAESLEIIKGLVEKGSLAARQRYISVSILDSSFASEEQVASLFSFASKGSILAETLLGYCYSNGIGVDKSKGTAVKYLRQAAQRGSMFAFSKLQKLYDNLRPSDPVFSLQ